MPVFIDRGGYLRCCGDVFLAIRCGGDFFSNKGTRHHRPKRFRSTRAAIPRFSPPVHQSVAFHEYGVAPRGSMRRIRQGVATEAYRMQPYS
jgi:hypothetical protein